MPTKPPNKKTQPGLGTAGAVEPAGSQSKMPRLDSAEMKRVRASFRTGQGAEKEKSDASPPPDSANPVRPRLRDSVRREDPDDEGKTEDHTVDTFTRGKGAAATTTSKTPSGGANPRTSASPTPPRTPSDRPRRPGAWEAEPTTGTRRKRSQRPPVTVDEVGTAAVKLARTTRRSESLAPKLVASRGMIAKAPIDTRAAFLLSLIDGRNTVDAIVDMSGMNQDEVKAILERLGRLGLISLPT